MQQKAWLATMAAVLGIADACHTHDDPAAAREVTPIASSTPSASASSAQVEAVAPSASASDLPVPSASVAASATATPLTQEQQIVAALSGSGVPIVSTIGIGNLHNNACGARAVCGVSSNVMRGPTAQISTQIGGAVGSDERIVAGMRSRFRSCANKALATDPSEQGRLTLRVTIAPTGVVTDATVTGNSGLSASNATCMAGVVRHAQFDALPAPRTIMLVIVQTKN